MAGGSEGGGVGVGVISVVTTGGGDDGVTIAIEVVVECGIILNEKGARMAMPRKQTMIISRLLDTRVDYNQLLSMAGGFSSLGGILSNYKVETNKQRRISREWQDYAYRLALELGDIEHTSLYMRLCKNTPRFILEEARSFVKGATNTKSPGKLFMWKVKRIKDEANAKVE